MHVQLKTTSQVIQVIFVFTVFIYLIKQLIQYYFILLNDCDKRSLCRGSLDSKPLRKAQGAGVEASVEAT